MSDRSPNVPDPTGASLRVGLCQVATDPWDLTGNLNRVQAALEAAARQGAEIAVLPECVLTGYPELDQPESRQRLCDMAEPINGPSISAIREAAKSLGLHVLLGFAERGEADRVYNSAALLSPDGNVPLVYRKIHCRRFESAPGDGVFTAGDTFAVVPLQGRECSVQIGCMICFDREVPESARCLRRLGAQLVLCPLATDTRDLRTWQTMADNEMITRCRAAENEIFVVVVNHAQRFNGGSFVVGPMGEVLAQLGAGPEVRVIDIPVGVVPAHYHAEPWGWMGWGYRRPDVYRRYL